MTSKDSGFFYTPYIPLQVDTLMTWREVLDYWSQFHSATRDTQQKVIEAMQSQFPGNYTIQADDNRKRVTFKTRYGVTALQTYYKLVFDTPEDETWFHLKYT